VIGAVVKTWPAVWVEAGEFVQSNEPISAGPTANVLLVPVFPPPSPVPVSVTVRCETSEPFRGSFARYAVTLPLATPFTNVSVG